MSIATEIHAANLPFLSLLERPSCRGNIRKLKASFACSSCNEAFPSADGVHVCSHIQMPPSIFGRQQVLQFNVGVNGAVESLRCAARQSHGLTRERLKLMADATAFNEGVFDTVLSRLPLVGMGGPHQAQTRSWQNVGAGRWCDPLGLRSSQCRGWNHRGVGR